GTNGQNPWWGPLTLDSSGNLFGTTQFGGLYNDGTVFQIAKGSNSINTLASFNGTNGFWPLGSVTLDSNGNIYGTTSEGGINNAGTVFEIVKGSGVITTLALFSQVNGADSPFGMVADSDGNLY